MSAWIDGDADKCTTSLTNRDLYNKQVAMLQCFLEHKAISQEQYQVSIDGLNQKMNLQPEE